MKCRKITLEVKSISLKKSDKFAMSMCF